MYVWPETDREVSAKDIYTGASPVTYSISHVVQWVDRCLAMMANDAAKV